MLHSAWVICAGQLLVFTSTSCASAVHYSINADDFTTLFGGSNIDESRNLALDAENNIIIVGITSSTDLPVTNNSITLT